MKRYVVTCGVIFALITVAHLWRIAQESRELARDPFFVATTVFAAVMSVWALMAVRGGSTK